MQTIINMFYVLLENANYYGILLLLFLAIFFMILAIAYIIRGRQSNTKVRLRKLVGKDGASISGNSPTRLLGQRQDTLASRISKPLHKLSSIEKRTVRLKMQLKLVRAGYRSDQAIYNYLAAKILCPLIYLSIFMFTNMVYNFQIKVFIYVVLLIIIGFFTPNLWVFLMTKTRQEKK